MVAAIANRRAGRINFIDLGRSRDRRGNNHTYQGHPLGVYRAIKPDGLNSPIPSTVSSQTLTAV